MASPGALEEEAEPQKLNRRCIYLHRLVGDDVRAPRTKSSRRTSWRVVLRFLVYGFIAIFTIRSRSNVFDLSEVNLGIDQAMGHRWFEREPTQKYFKDIRTIHDLKNWSRTAFLNQVSSNDPLARPLSLLGFNRITAVCGICPEFAAISITLRRAKLTTAYEETTTARFRKLVPIAWSTRQIHPQDEFVDAEATDTMTSTLDPTVTWAYTPKCTQACACVDGQHEGYHSHGGYVAVMTISAEGQYVHLVDNQQPITQGNRAQGVCEGIRKTNTITFDEFLESGFFDSQFAALTYEFIAYNPNLQVMSDVHATFVGENVGIIVDREIKAESIKLDIYDAVMRPFEIAYLIFTGCYFFEFCYRAYKYHPAFLYDVWSYVNLTSIVMSLTSLALWLTYMPQLQDFLATNDYTQPAKFVQIYTLSLWFLRCGSIATLTICLRILKFMGDLISRVRLLTRTISMAAKKIAIYVSYVLVVFFGFTFFAFIKFSATNPNFITVSSAFMSCFSLLLGDTRALQADNAITVLFFVLFIICFYFVSVQMFNAIINYAFNMVSEQMEPEFEQEQRERRRNQMQQLAASRNFLRNLRDYTLALFCRKTTEDPSGQKEGGEPEKKKTADGADRDRVHEKSHDKRKMPDSVCRILLFFIFAACYMWFLIVNLQIELSSDVREAIMGRVRGTAIQEYSVPGVVTEIRWDDIVSLSHVSSFLYGALPAIIFNSTSVDSTQRAEDLGIHNPGAVCIQSWNCIISASGYGSEVQAAPATPGTGTGQLNGTNATNLTTVTPAPENTWPPVQVSVPSTVPVPRLRSLVRITQRRAKVMANTGCTDPDSPPDQCFTGGNLVSTNFTNGTTNAQVMAPNRLPSQSILPGSPTNTFEQVQSTSYRIMHGDTPVCKGTLDTGFQKTGGIVCMLDADYTTFLNQLSQMEVNNFFTEGTASLAVDFATYNGNRDLLTYVIIEFAVNPGGGIWRRIRISSMTLMYFNYFLDTYAQIVVRILPGILYICLVMKFAFDLHWDLRQEIYRKRLSENSGWIVASVEFFTLDVFNLLEAVSISISFLSFVLYILWLAKESELDSMMNGDLNKLLDSLLDLFNQARLYNRLSALNCLLIFIRPLKFVRQSVRFAQLYQTLWDALSDITWFVFMFAVTMLGCVMYAHVSFGPSFEPCRSLPSTINFLFNYVRGNFNYNDLYKADPVMATFFFVPYLLSFSLVFLNIFFAIIDRYYSPKESPPLNIKRRLKPVFQRICRCIEWDEDYVMEQDPTEEKKLGPPSRQRKVHDLVQTINHTMIEHDHSAQLKSSKLLSDVCDTDERMGDVMHWSREEAGKFVMDFHRLLQKKQTVKNDEVFIKQDVMKTIRDESKVVREDMEESERLMRYATKVHEQMAMRDQETLARYILTLELKIRNRMKQRHELEREVRHLRSESDQMRFTREELSQQNGAVQVQAAERWAAEEKDAGSEESDEEPVPAIPPPGDPTAVVPADATNGTDPQANRKLEKTNALLNLRR